MNHVTYPQGDFIRHEANQMIVPDTPIIPYIQGDGIGADVTPVMKDVLNAAVAQAYDQKKCIAWMEIYAGDRAVDLYGEGQYLPTETIEVIKKCKVAIKGPLTTPVGEGIRSLNVTLRQDLDLYVCLRPVRYYPGTPSPVKNPEKVNMVIFRENSEDIYAGIEWPAGSDAANKLLLFLKDEMGVKKIRFSQNCGIGIKPVSKEGSKRLIRAAIQYAIDHDRQSVTLVHKGNIMKYTEGAFNNWGYELAREEFGATLYEDGPWHIFHSPKTQKPIIIKDAIADAFLQQILLRPSDYDVIATLNLNGDFISDALAAQVGGIGIAPGANIGSEYAVFEATHGTAPRYAGLNKANPGSLILSGQMMLAHLGWTEAAEIIEKGMRKAISDGQVTYDFHRLMPEATLLSASDFGKAVIHRMTE